MTLRIHLQSIKRVLQGEEKKSPSLFVKALNHFSACANVTNAKLMKYSVCVCGGARAVAHKSNASWSNLQRP